MTDRCPNLDWKAAADRLRSADRIAITSHVRSDVDGIGSAIALCRWLHAIGKEARILLPEVVDVSERRRLGPLVSAVTNCDGPTICIDHHINKDRRFADLDVIDPTAPSTGVLIWELFEHVEWEPDSVAVQAIYATLVADTGSFRFSNTTAAALRLAADLVDRGVQPQRVWRAVLGTYSQPRIRLAARALGQLELACDGRLAWFAVSTEALEELDASVADADGLIEYLRLIATVRAAIFFIELPGGEVKISFRCEDGLDVNALATRWGGGGHRHASGAVIPGALPAVVDEVVSVAKGLFE